MNPTNEIKVEQLIFAYTHGIFPMADENGLVNWYDPDPRAIIPLETYRPQKSLRSTLNSKLFEIRWNTQFETVMQHCAKSRYEGDGVWISENMVQAYVELHKMGHAHSVEAYLNGELAGGLYGVCFGKAFFGESMFTLVTNASKVAFHYLVEALKKNNFLLLDTQFINDNVKRYGAIEIPATTFHELLEKAIHD